LSSRAAGRTRSLAPVDTFGGSHCSPPTRRASPHLGTHATPACEQSQPSSSVHPSEQPSAGVALPSSHVSVPIRLPSPHFTRLTQGKPGSRQPWSRSTAEQSAAQPSPELAFASSHASSRPGSILPLPHPTAQSSPLHAPDAPPPPATPPAPPNGTGMPLVPPDVPPLPSRPPLAPIPPFPPTEARSPGPGGGALHANEKNETPAPRRTGSGERAVVTLMGELSKLLRILPVFTST
jgi:hypothetical protein